MPNSVAQRIGPLARIIHYLESTRGADTSITAGYVVPIRDQSGFQIERPEVEAPVYAGSLWPFSTAPGAVSAAGSLPCGLEFLYVGQPLKMPFGATGYTRVALPTGSVHNFYPPSGVATPLSAQLQAEFLETTAKYERAKYVMLRALTLSYAQGGAAPLDLDFVGSGDVADTDLAGTKTDPVYSAVSVYNGSARIANAALAPTWSTLVGIQGFRAGLDTGAVAEQVAFNDGVAGSVNPSIIKLNGNLELMFAADGSGEENNFTFRDRAKNRTLSSFECVWADNAVAVSPFPTKWLELRIASMRFGRRGPRPGGNPGLRTNQDWWTVPDATYSKLGARVFGTVVGPYLIGATTNIFSVQIDGGATIDTTLTQGAARTATEIVGELNANGTFAAAAVADVYHGRVRVTSKQATLTGSSSSVKFMTATTNNCGAVLGFNTTVVTGFSAPYVFTLYNLSNADYA